MTPRLSVLAFLITGFARAEFFPPAHGLFQPLQADRRELQFSLRLVVPVGHKNFGEAAAGDYFGLYRWDLGGEKFMQVSVGAGAFGRFDMSSKTNDMQVADYYGNLPVDLRIGRWSSRLLVYHTSSHLGDDYLKVHGGEMVKHSWDNLRWIGSYEPTSSWRLYGGYTYIFRTLPKAKRHAVQGGFEWKPRWLAWTHAQGYWANDFQSWERVFWNPMFNSEAGVLFFNKPEDHRGLSLFVEYFSGTMPQGQFYKQKETHVGVGVKLNFT